MHSQVRGRHSSCTNLSLFFIFPTEIMHTQVRGRHPSCTQFILAKPCILRWGGDTPAAPFYTLSKPCILGWGGDTPAAPVTHSLNLSYLDEGEIPRLHPLHTHWSLHTVIHLFFFITFHKDKFSWVREGGGGYLSYIIFFIQYSHNTLI